MGLGTVQQACRSCGWQVDIHPLEQLRGSELDSALSRLANGDYQLLLADLPPRRHMEHARKPH